MAAPYAGPRAPEPRTMTPENPHPQASERLTVVLPIESYLHRRHRNLVLVFLLLGIQLLLPVCQLAGLAAQSRDDLLLLLDLFPQAIQLGPEAWRLLPRFGGAFSLP